MKFDRYYEVIDRKGLVRFSSVYLHLAQGFVKERFEQDGVILEIEEVAR